MTMTGSLGRGWLLAGMLAGTAGGAGLAGAALAQHGGAMAAMHGHAMASMDPAAMDARFESHLAEMVPDATPDQKARLKAIATRVHAALGAIPAQMGETHRRAHAMLLAASIDRAVLERLRTEQLRQIDATSRRLLAGIADAAEVLTPEQ